MENLRKRIIEVAKTNALSHLQAALSFAKDTESDDAIKCIEVSISACIGFFDDHKPEPVPVHTQAQVSVPVPVAESKSTVWRGWNVVAGK